VQWVAVKLPIVFCVKSETFFIQKVLLYLSAQTVNLMEDFGDYIYLIVIAIAALSSLFKKKKPAQAMPLPPDDELNEADEEFKDIFREKTIVPEQVFVPTVKMTAAPQKPVHKVFDSMNDTMELRIKKSPRSKIDIDMPEEQVSTMTVELETVEQARRAFIYSEIFNRKY